MSKQNTNESAAEWVAIESLKPWENNPRKNDGKPVAKVAESIKRFGFASPIIARKANGEIIAGHTRWKAAKSLGLDRVPVRYLDLDPTQSHLLALADNRAAQNATWDDEVLSAVLAELSRENVPLDATGFDESELTRLLASMNDDLPEAAGLDDIPEQFSVVVKCNSEMEQAELLTRLQSDGYDVRAMLS
jgi:ParB/RepB/Spo0J family partition protein